MTTSNSVVLDRTTDIPLILQQIAGEIVVARRQGRPESELEALIADYHALRECLRQ